MGFADFLPYPVEISELLGSPTGAVGRHVINLATIVQLAAQTSLVPGHGYRTGRLKAGIVKRIMPSLDPVSVDVEVGVYTVPYALWVHEGTEPHDIPNAFGWGPTFGIGGRFSGKFHPGTKPIPFLTDALGAVASQL
jgi:hypothetical protein